MSQPRRRVRKDPLADRLARHQAAGLQTAPKERWQHGQELSPEPMQRAPHQVASGVQALYDANSIGDAARSAAARFHNDYVLGVLGVRDRGGDGGAFDPHVVQLARVRAVGAHRAIAGMLGADLTTYLLAFVVEDLSFSAMNRRFGGGAAAPDHRKEFSVTVRVLLCVLPGIYSAIDRKRSAAQARPVTVAAIASEVAAWRLAGGISPINGVRGT